MLWLAFSPLWRACHPQDEREAKLRKKNLSSPKRRPLYLQMEEQYRQKEAQEEARRRETLKVQRAKFEPVRSIVSLSGAQQVQ